MKDFFEAPYINVPIYVNTSMRMQQIGLNDTPKSRQKKYIKQKIEITFPTNVLDNRSWSEKAMDAVANFVSTSDVYMNRTRIVEAAFLKTRGAVWIECYLLEGKKYE